MHYHNQPHEFRRPRQDGLLDRLVAAIRPGTGNAGSDTLATRIRTLAGTAGDQVLEQYAPSPGGGAALEETAVARLLDSTGPAVGFQVDVGSVAGAGFDPTAVLDTFGPRIEMLHLSDVVVDTPGPMAAVTGVEVGAGLVDVESVLETATETDVEWIIYENDSPADPARPLERGRELFDEASAVRAVDS